MATLFKCIGVAMQDNLELIMVTVLRYRPTQNVSKIRLITKLYIQTFETCRQWRAILCRCNLTRLDCGPVRETLEDMLSFVRIAQ